MKRSRQWAGALMLNFLASVMAVEPVGVDSQSANWPRLFGPTGDSIVPDQPLDLGRIEKDLPILWEHELGESYSSPAIHGNRIILFHRINDEEIIDCLDVETTKRKWRFRYPSQYVDRYGYNNGPRSTPIIVDDVVYTLGAEGQMHALRLEDGQKSGIGGSTMILKSNKSSSAWEDPPVSMEIG